MYEKFENAGYLLCLSIFKGKIQSFRNGSVLIQFASKMAACNFAD